MQAKQLEIRGNDQHTEQVPRELLASVQSESPAIIINAQVRGACGALGMAPGPLAALPGGHVVPCAVLAAQTMIMWANNPLCLTFGYTRAELMNKSVSMLMPSPLAEMHSQLVRHYVTTGEERIINKQIEHMVINRAKQVWAALRVEHFTSGGAIFAASR